MSKECKHWDTKIEKDPKFGFNLYRRVCNNCLASTKWCYSYIEAERAKFEK